MQNNLVLKPASVRHNNYRSILLTIRSKGVCTVADIAEELGLSKTAVFKAILKLTELGFVVSAGKGTSTATGGKPPENYSINPNCRYTCTITFYHDIIIAHIHNFLGEKIYQTSFPLPDNTSTISQEEAIDLCAEWVTQALGYCNLNPSRLCGVIVLHDNETNRQDPMYHFVKDKQSVPTFKKLLAEKLKVPDIIHVEHAKDMRGYAELHADNSRKQKLVVVVSVLKEEVTGCILHYGTVLHGMSGTAADFAHIPTDYAMRNQCTCGRRGCFASAALKRYILKGISRELKAGSPSILQEPFNNQTLNMVAVVSAAEAGDELAKRHMDIVLENYTHLLYTIYMTLNPDEIVVQAGPHGQAFHERELNQRFRELNLPKQAYQDVVKISTSLIEPFKATAIGAAFYCIDQYLENPICFEV